MKPRWVVARRELASALRERTILLAIVIQVFVAGFSGFLVVGLSALLDPDAQPVGATPVVATVAQSDLPARLTAAGLAVALYGNESDARAAFDLGRADAILVERDASALPREVVLTLPEGEFTATFTLVKVKAALEDYEADLREVHASRLSARPAQYESPAPAGSFGFVYSLMVPLLLLLPAVLAGALVADSLTEEVQRGTLPLLLSSPATAGDVVEGKLLGSILLVPLLAAAWLALLALNGLTVSLAAAVLLLVLDTALAVVFALVACGVALWTRDRNRAQIVYATAFFLLLELSLGLPVSPANAMALLAAGSAGPAAYAVVVGSVALAAGGWLALRAALRRVAPRLAAGA